uniref:mucin-2-like n=1 Tax=Myxine glutinosa TaxID=7769 RepID=UPI00358F20FE
MTEQTQIPPISFAPDERTSITPAVETDISSRKPTAADVLDTSPSAEVTFSETTFSTPTVGTLSPEASSELQTISPGTSPTEIPFISSATEEHRMTPSPTSLMNISSTETTISATSLSTEEVTSPSMPADATFSETTTTKSTEEPTLSLIHTVLPAVLPTTNYTKIPEYSTSSTEPSTPPTTAVKTPRVVPTSELLPDTATATSRDEVFETKLASTILPRPTVKLTTEQTRIPPISFAPDERTSITPSIETDISSRKPTAADVLDTSPSAEVTFSETTFSTPTVGTLSPEASSELQTISPGTSLTEIPFISSSTEELRMTPSPTSVMNISTTETTISATSLSTEEVASPSMPADATFSETTTPKSTQEPTLSLIHTVLPAVLLTTNYTKIPEYSPSSTEPSTPPTTAVKTPHVVPTSELLPDTATATSRDEVFETKLASTIRPRPTVKLMTEQTQIPPISFAPDERTSITPAVETDISSRKPTAADVLDTSPSAEVTFSETTFSTPTVGTLSPEASSELQTISPGTSPTEIPFISSATEEHRMTPSPTSLMNISSTETTISATSLSTEEVTSPSMPADATFSETTTTKSTEEPTLSLIHTVLPAVLPTTNYTKIPEYSTSSTEPSTPPTTAVKTPRVVPTSELLPDTATATSRDEVFETKLASTILPRPTVKLTTEQTRIPPISFAPDERTSITPSIETDISSRKPTAADVLDTSPSAVVTFSETTFSTPTVGTLSPEASSELQTISPGTSLTEIPFISSSTEELRMTPSPTSVMNISTTETTISATSLSTEEVASPSMPADATFSEMTTPKSTQEPTLSLIHTVLPAVLLTTNYTKIPEYSPSSTEPSTPPTIAAKTPHVVPTSELLHDTATATSRDEVFETKLASTILPTPTVKLMTEQTWIPTISFVPDERTSITPAIETDISSRKPTATDVLDTSPSAEVTFSETTFSARTDDTLSPEVSSEWHSISHGTSPTEIPLISSSTEEVRMTPSPTSLMNVSTTETMISAASLSTEKVAFPSMPAEATFSERTTTKTTQEPTLSPIHTVLPAVLLTKTTFDHTKIPEYSPSSTEPSTHPTTAFKTPRAFPTSKFLPDPATATSREEVFETKPGSTIIPRPTVELTTERTRIPPISFVPDERTSSTPAIETDISSRKPTAADVLENSPSAEVTFSETSFSARTDGTLSPETSSELQTISHGTSPTEIPFISSSTEELRMTPSPTSVTNISTPETTISATCLSTEEVASPSMPADATFSERITTKTTQDPTLSLIHTVLPAVLLTTNFTKIPEYLSYSDEPSTHSSNAVKTPRVFPTSKFLPDTEMAPTPVEVIASSLVSAVLPSTSAEVSPEFGSTSRSQSSHFPPEDFFSATPRFSITRSRPSTTISMDGSKDFLFPTSPGFQDESVHVPHGIPGIQSVPEGVSKCSPSFCFNGGTCVNNARGFICICLPSYSGRQCEEDTVMCQSGWHKFRGQCYRHVRSWRTWHEAERHCVSCGAHLTSVLYEGEQIFLNSFGSNYQWIGLNDRLVKGHFLWTDGNYLGYNDWGPGQPDGRYPRKRCVFTVPNSRGTWNNALCTYRMRYTCKKAPTEAVACGHPPVVPHARLLGHPRATAPVHAMVRYACTPGYVTRSRTVIHCRPNGAWEVPRVTCCSRKGPLCSNTRWRPRLKPLPPKRQTWNRRRPGHHAGLWHWRHRSLSGSRTTQ